jgi:hypothetical protein
MKQLFSFLWRMAVVVLIAFIAYWFIFVPRWVYDHGTPARAEVIDVWDTSTMVNEEPLVGILLEVSTGRGESFQVKKYCRYTFGDEYLFNVGTQVQVRYNPGFPERVVLTESSCDTSNASFFTIAVVVVGFNLFIWVLLPPIIGLLSFINERKGKRPEKPASTPAPNQSLTGNMKIVRNEKATTVERLLNLDELYQRNLISEAEYKRLREGIIQSI